MLGWVGWEEKFETEEVMIGCFFLAQVNCGYTCILGGCIFPAAEFFLKKKLVSEKIFRIALAAPQAAPTMAQMALILCLAPCIYSAGAVVACPSAQPHFGAAGGLSGLRMSPKRSRIPLENWHGSSSLLDGSGAWRQ